jgi:tetratricopeptide (TPR) repeat protein
MVVAALRGDIEKFEALEAEGVLPFPLRRAALLNRGLLLESQGDRSGARAIYRQVAARYSAHPESHNRLGNMDFQEGYADLAASSYEAALRADPDHVDALYNLGVVRFGQGSYAEAVLLWEAVLRQRPGHPQARRHLVDARRRALRSGATGGRPLKPEPR